jgi:hypothetical protein
VPRFGCQVEGGRSGADEQDLETPVLAERRLYVAGLTAICVVMEIGDQDGEVGALGARHLAPPPPPPARDPPRRGQELL